MAARSGDGGDGGGRVIPLRLSQVAEATGGEVVSGDPGTTVERLTTDSRDVPPRSLFVALRGENHDGHDHIDEALDAGAIAYLAEHATDRDGAVVVDDTWEAVTELGGWVRHQVDPTVVAVTGSVGKTTTKDLLAAAIGAQRRTVAAQGSYNNELGVPLTCLSTEPDTEVLVVEVGSRGVGHIESLMPIVGPDVSVVTAVAAAHLEMFGDLDTVQRAKAELVEALNSSGTAVLNADDPRVLAMRRRTEASTVTYGRQPEVEVEGSVVEVDVVGEDVHLDRLARARFRARTPWGSADVVLPLAGDQFVGNALAALAVAGSLGVEIGAAADALAEAPISSWRGAVDEVEGTVVINDAYNANPLSVRAALRTLAAVERPSDGRTWAVLGIMAELGPDADDEHAAVGEVVRELGIDRLIAVGEGTAPVLEGAAAAGMPQHARWHVEDAAAALELLRDDARPGDVVLVKGSRVAGLEAVADGLEEHLRGDGGRR